MVDGHPAARAADRGIVWGLGAHVIKTGLAPVLIDLMERGFVSAIALNGAGLIHDFEVALGGSTSEDVDAALGQGQFGMAEETGRGLNEIITDGRGRRTGDRTGGRGAPRSSEAAVRATSAAGCGRAARRARDRSRGASGRISSTCTRRRLVRRSARAACATSVTSTSSVARLAGGVYLNCGSAVLLARSLSEGRVARAQSWHLARRPHDGQSRFRQALSSGDRTSSVARSPASARVLNHGTSRDPAAAARSDLVESSMTK